METRHRCDRCGSHDWEWDDGDQWVADTHLCPGCYHVDRKLAEVQGASGSPYGLTVRLYRNE